MRFRKPFKRVESLFTLKGLYHRYFYDLYPHALYNDLCDFREREGF